MRFDYYQATMPGDSEKNLAVLAGLGDELRPAQGLAKMYRYDRGYAVYSKGVGPVAHVFAGGQGGTVHGFASGEDTQEFVRLVRAECPGHRVTRADAAEDFNEKGAYDRVRELLRPIVAQHGVSFLQYADDLDECAGRTQYVGRPKSDVRVRLYEKGWQEAAKTLGWLGVPDSDLRIVNRTTGELISPECWTRIEAQVRPPDDKGKVWLATASPDAVWGCSPWLRDVAQKVLALELERFVMTRRKETTVDRALRIMCSQYGRSMEKKVEELGLSWEEFGKHLQSVMRDHERARRTGMV